MVPVQVFVLEEHRHEDGEHRERYDLLYHLELDEREWASILGKPDAVGWHHEQVLEKGDAPREEDDHNEWPMGANSHLLQFQVAVPSKRHHGVAEQQQCQCDNYSPVHFFKCQLFHFYGYLIK